VVVEHKGNVTQAGLFEVDLLCLEAPRRVPHPAVRVTLVTRREFDRLYRPCQALLVT
jgi:hypothetical protein